MNEAIYTDSTGYIQNQGYLIDNPYNAYYDTIDISGDSAYQILTTEKERLDKKEEQIKPLYDTFQRQKAHQKSENLRSRAYYRMTFIFAMIIILATFLFLLKRYVEVIPDIVIDLLLVIIIGGGIILLFILHADIASRDKMDFEKVDFGLLLDVEKVKSKNTLDGIGFELSGACIGAMCCPTGSTFKDNRCISNNLIEPFSSSSNRAQFHDIKPYYQLPSFSTV